MLLAAFGSLSADGDCSCLVALGPWQEQCQNALAIFRLDALGLQPDWKGNRAVELPGDAFAAVHADAVRVGYRLLSRDTDCVFLGLDLQTALVDARQLDDRQKIAALLKDVDRRERPLARR